MAGPGALQGPVGGSEGSANSVVALAAQAIGRGRDRLCHQQDTKPSGPIGWCCHISRSVIDPGEPSDALSLRGRRLEGAVFVGAHLKEADFTGAQLARAFFLVTDLRDAKFECDKAGEENRCAQLQGAYLEAAQLQGTSIKDAQLQGAYLRAAQLQGASLDGAQLQGANLDGAQLQGAHLTAVQLQGASLVDAHLEGASLRDVFVWRTNPQAEAEYAWIVNPVPKPKYSGLDCAPSRACDWTDQGYAALKVIVEAVPLGSLRDLALGRIEPLGKTPYEEDGMSAKDWRRLAAESRRSAEVHPGELERRLIGIGCAVEGAPYVIRGLIEQLDVRFQHNSARKTEIAGAFLDEANCPGAQGLSEENKATLRRNARLGRSAVEHRPHIAIRQAKASAAANVTRCGPTGSLSRGARLRPLPRIWPSRSTGGRPACRARNRYRPTRSRDRPGWRSAPAARRPDRDAR